MNLSETDPVTEWHSALNEAGIQFAVKTSDLARCRPEGDSTMALEQALWTAVSWWIDYGHTKQEIVRALVSASQSPELGLEGWTGKVDWNA